MRGTARAELHYTGFEDAAAFRELLSRHGLSYAATREYELDAGELGPVPAGWHVWCGDGIHLLTACDPIDGEHAEPGVEGCIGYASYTTIEGRLPAAGELYRDVLDTAEYVKGEFVPLTAGDGEVIAEEWRGESV